MKNYFFETNTKITEHFPFLIRKSQTRLPNKADEANNRGEEWRASEWVRQSFSRWLHTPRPSVCPPPIYPLPYQIIIHLPPLDHRTTVNHLPSGDHSGLSPQALISPGWIFLLPVSLWLCVSSSSPCPGRRARFGFWDGLVICCEMAFLWTGWDGCGRATVSAAVTS